MATAQHLPKIQLEKVLYTHYQHPNLAAVHKFFLDFGFVVAQKTDEIVYYRGFGDSPYVYVAEKSPDNLKHFVGGGWVVRSESDLEVAARLPGASDIQELHAPGGGRFVDVKDPNGINVRLIYGIKLRESKSLEQERPKPDIFNSWEYKPRQGEFQRYEGPSKIHKLGHYGLTVDRSRFDVTIEWYSETFSLAHSDSVYERKSGKDMMYFLHIDKGEEFVDHHSFFVQCPPMPVKGCRPHHSSFEVDNIDTQLTGHYHLEKSGWTNCWGVGRHLMGSQIFDYWFDPSGNVIEHYSDGDVVNCHTPVAREIAEPDSMAVWGPNVPVAFLTGRIEDLDKGLAVH